MRHADPLAPGVAVGWPSHARVVDGVADGAGYVDFGQEDWDDEAYSGDEADPNKRAKTAGARSSGVFNNLQVKRKNKATDRVSNMFLGGGGRDGTLGPSSSGKVRPPNQPSPHFPPPVCQTSNQVTPSLRLPRAAAVCAAAAHRSPRALAAGQGEPGRERRLAARRPA